jgi:diguanylate cyclase (GGDEF)-like protein
MNATNLSTSAVRHWLHWLHRGTEPHILFPAIAVIALAVIWATTLNLIRTERIAAVHRVATSNHQLAETYEAQVVRALREIDQTLKIVKYAADVWGKQSVLPKLKTRGLLPPALVFTISVTDSKGNIVASTSSAKLANVAGQDYFQAQRQADTLSISSPQHGTDPGVGQLYFSRRLNTADGRFSGIVMLSVDAAYFVSSYESSIIGEHGLLGMFGTDGLFLARRSGETVSAGGRIDYAAMKVHQEGEADSETMLSVDPLDGVLRYTSARQLYEFPLTVIVGLSADEQLAPTRRNEQIYLGMASAGSLLLILTIAVLGFMSRQIALKRRQLAQAQLTQAEHNQYLAYHDGLTALPNRSLFSELLGQGIHLALRNNRQLALLFLDLDRFKHINDTLGHEAGDQLLQEAALRLKACLRDSDTVARLGGDEFVVLLPELLEDRYVATVARKILAALARPFILQDQEFRVTASVGISIYPQDGLDEQTLTNNADVAMYHAKEQGRNNFKFYSEQLNADSRERLTLESGLRHALERHELQLHYQARRDIHSGLITGMEALLRWQHPELGTLAPLQFLPLAEETGLILPIGKWVIRTACLQNMAWQKQGLPPVSMAVNLSPRQFEDEDLLPDLTAILADSGMDAQLLELEVSEALLMRDIDTKLRILAGLKDIGVRIAIDDFGNSYALLAALRQFPLDTIKLDRAFIRNLTSVSEDKALTRAVIALGRTLSPIVVVQGVETKEQADFLRRYAAGEFQGFYLNRPMPADQMAELLQAQAAVAESDARTAD